MTVHVFDTHSEYSEQGRIACRVDVGGDEPLVLVLHVNFDPHDGRWWSTVRWKPEDGPSRNSKPRPVEARA